MKHLFQGKNEEKIFAKSKRAWEENPQIFSETRLQFPDENLVRIFAGSYTEIPPPPAQLVDIGFGHANNLKFFAQRGYICAGCEISEHFIKEARLSLRKSGFVMDLRCVEDLNLPFEDNAFDVAVSWNVLHYNGTRPAVQKVINETRRVLKPGGTLILSTISADSFFAQRSKSLGDGSFLIQTESPHDNRRDLTLFMLKDVSELAKLFSSFAKVKTGQTGFNLFNDTRRTRWHLIQATK